MRPTVNSISTTAAAVIVRSKLVRIILVMATGSVQVSGEVRNRLTATSSIENAKTAPAIMPVRASGKVMSQKARRSVAPRLIAASVRVLRMPTRPASVVRTV